MEAILLAPLERHSEQYTATGNLASEGVLNQLGRPAMDLLTVMIRETVQNSWDARDPNGQTVRYGIDCRTLTSAQLTLLRDVVFQDLPDPVGDLDLQTSISGGAGVQVLTIYDRGTVGLGGPTRADVIDQDGEPRDFVDFLRNIGQPQNRQMGGGTYGYGKASLYLASRVHTICVHTHCMTGGVPESRFMAAALGPQYIVSDDGPTRGRYTGRHWWGRIEAGVVEPLRGTTADELAMQLGLPLFGPGERGTTLVILAPVLSDRTPHQVIRQATVDLLWNFWPKMLRRPDGTRPMDFEIVLDGTQHPVPDPTRFPPLQGFVQAMEALKQSGPEGNRSVFGEVSSIRADRPKKHLGMLSLQRFETRKRVAVDTGTEYIPPVGPLCHHVALMRQAELVVKYVSGPELPGDTIEYAGVFLADAEVDGTFARSEPPTHDDWSYQFLEDRHEKTFVRVALRRIEDRLRDFVAPPSPAPGRGQATPLAAFADRMGGLLPGNDGSERQKKELRPNGKSDVREKVQLDRPHRSRPVAARLIIHEHGNLDIIDGIPGLTITFSVEHAQDTEGTGVRLQAGAILDGSEIEAEPPAGGEAPRVLWWAGPEGQIHPGTPNIVIPNMPAGRWTVAVGFPEEMMLGVSLGIVHTREQ